MMSISAVRPCLCAFHRERALPAAVFGPVLFLALALFASICLIDVISFSILQSF